MTKETIKILRDDTFISPRLKIAGTTLSPFGKQLTSNLVINPIGQYSLFLALSERQISLANGFGDYSYPIERYPPSIFHQLGRSRLSIGPGFVPYWHSSPRSVPVFLRFLLPLGGAIRVGRAGHLLYARRKGGRRYKGGAKQEGTSSSSSSVKTSRGVANGLVLETSRAGFRIPLPR